MRVQMKKLPCLMTISRDETTCGPTYLFIFSFDPAILANYSKNVQSRWANAKKNKINYSKSKQATFYFETFYFIERKKSKRSTDDEV